MDNLGDFFSAIGGEKKKQKQKVEESLQRKEMELEQLKKDAKIFEGLFFAPEEDTLGEVIDNPQWKRFFNTAPPQVKTDNWREDYKPTEIETFDIIKPEPLKPSPGAERFEMNENVANWKKTLDVLKEKENWITENQEAQDTVQEQINLLRMQLAQTQAKVEVQGGGGAVWMWDLDDVNVGSPGPTGYPPIADGTLLIWDHSEDRWVGIASTAINSTADTELDHVLKAGNISGMGMSVGFITATGGLFSNNVTIGGTLQAGSSLILGDVTIKGNVDIAGTVTKEDVTEIDSIGIITARKGIISLGIVTSVGFDGPLEGDVLAGVVTTGQLQVTGSSSLNNLYVAGVSTFVGITTHQSTINFTNNVGYYIKGTPSSKISIAANGVITGIALEASSFIKSDGSLNVAGLTTTKNLLVVGVSTFQGQVTSGDINSSGVVTATSYSGNGINLTGIVTTITAGENISIDQSTGNVTITGLAKTDRITAESLVVTGISTFGNQINVTDINASGVVTATSFVGNGVNLTGIVTSLLAGPNISVSGSSGQVTITGLANTANVSTNTLNVIGVTTLASSGGITTTGGDLYVGGDLFVKDDVFKHEISGVNALITGIATIGSLNVTGPSDFIDINASGVITATSYFGDGSNLTNIISGVGIQSGGTIIGTGFTDINFVGSGVTSVVAAGTTVNVTIDSTAIRRQVNTASGTTSSFTISDGYPVGYIDVYLNGVKLRNGTDFTASNGTSVTMTPAVVNGDVVEFQIYDSVSVATPDITTLRNALQGYYGYTTDYYTVGVANTIQILPADEFVLIQPQVGAGGTYPHLPTDMTTANGGDPWIGAGATIGTGQTSFSLAGTTAHANCIVRISYNYIPDVDDAEVTLCLKFTTNTATQGTGLTNFTIAKQGLVCVSGAGITYSGEDVIPFFVGSTLEGTNKTDAGKFEIQVRGSEIGEFEIQAVNVVVDM